MLQCGVPGVEAYRPCDGGGSESQATMCLKSCLQSGQQVNVTSNRNVIRNLLLQTQIAQPLQDNVVDVGIAGMAMSASCRSMPPTLALPLTAM